MTEYSISTRVCILVFCPCSIFKTMDKIDCDRVIMCNSDLSSSHCCGSMLIMTGLDEK